jgi:L-alanine-DL-glutamate epimerase-like enolase superfamily enzyme
VQLTITEIERIDFKYELPDTAVDEHGFNIVYEVGSTTERTATLFRVHTDGGVTGEYVGGSIPAHSQLQSVVNYLVGKDALKRERHWSELKRALRKYDRTGIGPVDIALWDIAGKCYEAPIHELLGSYRDRLPAYASTPHGDENGGLDSPEAFADFAEECLDLGYPAFKIHGWGGSDASRDVDRERRTVLTVGERVGDEMDLMLDPACEYETFGDALKIGRACDEAGFFWFEDPYRDGGISQHGHRKLRQQLETPLLQGEHVRGLELKTDFIATESTDFMRANPTLDAGITGAMKIARVAEGFGIDVEYHGPGPAKRHCMAATRNANYYEMGLVHPDWARRSGPPVYAGDYEDELTTIDDRGRVPVPDGPGLGVEYDLEFIRDRAVDTRRYD